MHRARSAEDVADLHPVADRGPRLVRIGGAVVTNRTLRVAALVGAVVVSLWNVDRLSP